MGSRVIDKKINDCSSCFIPLAASIFSRSHQQSLPGVSDGLWWARAKLKLCRSSVHCIFAALIPAHCIFAALVHLYCIFANLIPDTFCRIHPCALYFRRPHPCALYQYLCSPPPCTLYFSTLIPEHCIFCSSPSAHYIFKANK